MPSRLFRASFGKIELTGRLEVFAFQSSDIVRSPGNIAPRQFGGNRGKGIGRTGHGRQDHQFRLFVADEPRDMLDHCWRAYGGSSELHDFD